MSRDLRGLRILITQATSELGRELVAIAGAAGARLAITASDRDALESLLQSLRSKKVDAVAIPANLHDDQERRRLLQTVTDHWNGLDVLINDAVPIEHENFADSTEETLRRVLEETFFSPVELTRLAIPTLMKGRQPAIVNVSSVCGRRGLPAHSASSASAFALCGMTEALRGEMARFDIDVLLVLPGVGSGPPAFDDELPPAAIAQGVVDALQQNRTETVLGSRARRIVRMQRFFPRWLERRIRSAVR